MDGGPGPDPTFGAARISVSPRRTAALARLARRHDISFNSLLSGLIAAAVHPFLDPADEPASVQCRIAVDMRRRLRPPLPDEVVQSAASGIPVRLQLGMDADPVTLGREVAQAIHKGLAEELAERELAAFVHMLQQRPPTLGITGLGRIAPPELPAGVAVTGLRVLPVTHLPLPFVAYSRFGPALGIDIPFSRAWFADGDIEDFASALRELIEKNTVDR